MGGALHGAGVAAIRSALSRTVLFDHLHRFLTLAPFVAAQFWLAIHSPGEGIIRQTPLAAGKSE